MEKAGMLYWRAVVKARIDGGQYSYFTLEEVVSEVLTGKGRQSWMNLAELKYPILRWRELKAKLGTK